MTVLVCQVAEELLYLYKASLCSRHFRICLNSTVLTLRSLSLSLLFIFEKAYTTFPDEYLFRKYLAYLDVTFFSEFPKLNGIASDIFLFVFGVHEYFIVN